jgi:hypothetical protein
MPLPAPDFERLFAPGTRHALPGAGTVTIRLRTGTELSLPSGRVVAGEPFMFGAMEDSSGFVQRVPPGRYPLVLVLGVFGEDPDDPDAHATIAAARLVIRDEPVVSWEMAVHEGQDPDRLGDDEFFGYPVDGGTGGFVDAQNIAALCADHDDYLDRLMIALDVREEDYVAPAVLTNEASDPVVVAFSSGGGDGVYPTWVGRTAGGEVACLLTDFFLLPGEDAGEEETGEQAPAPDFRLSDFAQGHEMRIGQTLRRQSLTSPSGRYAFVHQDDGNLVLYDNVRLIARWASGTDGSGARLCTVRETEGLVLLGEDGRPVWSSGTWGDAAARLTVRDDGDLVLQDFAGTTVWSSGTAEAVVPDGPAATGDRMLGGQTLSRQSLTSPSGRHTFVHQDDGNLVLYDNERDHAVWSSGTDGGETSRCVLHLDGDLALYDRRAHVVWSTNTGGNTGSMLVVDDDGVALRTPDGAVLWSVPAGAQPSRPFLATRAQPLSPLRPASPGRPMVPARPAVPVRPAMPARPASAAVARPPDETS